MVHPRLQLTIALWALAGFCEAAAGVTGGDVLKARMGARSAALGEAYTALGDDLGAAGYNPAGLIGIKGPSLAFMHWSAIAQVSYENFGYAHPLKFGTLAASVLLRNQPDIKNPLAPDNPVSAYDVVVALSYAQRPSYFLDNLPEGLRKLNAGISLKYLRSHLARFDAETVAADIGLNAPLEEGLSAGLSLLNLGPPLKFISTADPLPTALLGGVAKRLEIGKESSLTALADIEYPFQGDVRIHTGAEAWLGKGLALRLGYTIESADNLGGLSAGFALRLDQESLAFSFDYAWRPSYYAGFNSFDPQHLFAMNLGFL